MRRKLTGKFQIYEQVQTGKNKFGRRWFAESFETRQQARQWCRNHSSPWDRFIVSPDGTKEKFEWNYDR